MQVDNLTLPYIKGNCFSADVQTLLCKVVNIFMFGDILKSLQKNVCVIFFIIFVCIQTFFVELNMSNFVFPYSAILDGPILGNSQGVL